MPASTADLVRYFVTCVPGAGRTQIMKFLYLADLESRRLRGKPISSLDYIWYEFGPFDSSVLANLDGLMRTEKIRGELVRYPNGIAGWRYFPSEGEPGPSWSEEDKIILDFVWQTYGHTDLQPLLDEIVYRTAPMVYAQQNEE